VLAFISSISKKKAIGNFNEENVIIPSAIVISEGNLSSVHVLYATALERYYKIKVTLNIHAMALKSFSSAKIEAAGQMKGYVTLQCSILTACLRESLSCPSPIRMFAPWGSNDRISVRMLLFIRIEQYLRTGHACLRTSKDFLTPENGSDRLSRNVDRDLPLYAE
jgi:hypothetical protein